MLDRVLANIRTAESRSVAELERLVRQPSVAATGEGIAATTAVVRQMMEDRGMTVRLLPVEGAPPVVMGELNVGAPRTLLFYNHYDVQPADPLSEWESPPFEPTLRDGRLFGRGVADNKGNLVARLQAIQAWRAAGGPPVNIKMVCEGAEEIGSPGLTEFVHANKDLLACDGVMWESGGLDAAGRQQVTCGVKGLLYVELRARWANQDLHSMQAAAVESPVWHLLDVVAGLKEVGSERVLLPGFYDDVRRPTAAELALARSAPLAEAQLLELYGIERFAAGVSGAALSERLQFEPTCNICGMLAGYTGSGIKTVLPKEAMVKIDFRLVPDQRTDDIYEKLRHYVAQRSKGRVEVVMLAAEEPAQAPIDDPLVHIAADAARHAWGKDAVVLPRIVGTGPIHPFLSELGVAVVNGSGCGNPGSRPHSPNENIFVSDFLRTIEQTVRIIDGFGQL